MHHIRCSIMFGMIPNDCLSTDTSPLKAWGSMEQGNIPWIGSGYIWDSMVSGSLPRTMDHKNSPWPKNVIGWDVRPKSLFHQHSQLDSIARGSQPSFVSWQLGISKGGFPRRWRADWGWMLLAKSSTNRPCSTDRLAQPEWSKWIHGLLENPWDIDDCPMNVKKSI